MTTKLTSEKAVTKVSGTDIKFGKKLPVMKYILDQRMGQTVHAHW